MTIRMDDPGAFANWLYRDYRDREPIVSFEWQQAMDKAGRLNNPLMALAVNDEQSCFNARIEWMVDVGRYQHRAVWSNYTQIVRNVVWLDPAWSYREIEHQRDKLIRDHIAEWEKTAIWGVPQRDLNPHVYQLSGGVQHYLGRIFVADDKIRLRTLRKPMFRRYERTPFSGTWYLEILSEATFEIHPGSLGVIEKPKEPVVKSPKSVFEHTYAEGATIDIQHDEKNRIVRVTSW